MGIDYESIEGNTSLEKSTESCVMKCVWFP